MQPEEKAGLHIFYKIVSTFPQLVELINWIGIAVAAIFFWLAWTNANSIIKTTIGAKQDEHHIKKALSYTFFGICLWNLGWTTEIILRSAGLNLAEQEYIDYLSGEIFQKNNNMSDLLSYIIWICNMIGYIGMFSFFIKANQAVIHPEPKSASRAIRLLIVSIALLRIKECLWILAWILSSNSLYKWLGYST